jgi:hypothetical protein
MTLKYQATCAAAWWYRETLTLVSPLSCLLSQSLAAASVDHFVTSALSLRLSVVMGHCHDISSILSFMILSLFDDTVSIADFIHQQIISSINPE